MSRRLFALLALVGIALAPVAAEARSRTSDMLMDEFRQRSGYGDSTIQRYVAPHQVNDIELLPGLFESFGGFTSRYRDRGVSLSALRLFNEGSVPICVRTKARMISGALANSRSAGNMGINMLIEPGRSENIMAYTADRYIGGTGEQWERGYYFWLPGPASMEKRCSGNAPADLMQWDALPLSRSRGVSYSPELGRRLGMIPAQQATRPQQSTPAPQASTGISVSPRTGLYWLERINKGPGGEPRPPVRELERLQNSKSSIETSLVVGHLGTGWMAATDWFYNGRARTVCMVAQGDFNASLVSPQRRVVQSTGPKAIPPGFGVFGIGYETTPKPRPDSAGMQWNVRYFVWSPPANANNDQGCINSFDRQAVARLPKQSTPGEIVILSPLQ